MQKWISLLALGLMMGCATLPPETGTFQLEAARTQATERHVQQVFSTPTPAPVGGLSSLEAAKSNKLLDHAVRELTAAHREVSTRLSRERDRNMQIFAVPDPYTGRTVPASIMRGYRTNQDAIISNLGVAYQNQIDALADFRNRDLKTANKEIVRAKTAWYRARFMFERQSLGGRATLTREYQKIVKARRKLR